MSRLMNFVAAKQVVKTRIRAFRSAYIRRLHSFDVDDLSAGLRRVGVASGDVLFVHSSFDSFTGFTGRPTDVLNALDRAVGADGAILMPSLPFGGSALKYVQSGAITDIARTPSRTGLLTELFRRRKGTIRSVHPTHPVLAHGAGVEAMIAGHLEALSPCGAGSPFARLLEVQGKILFLGVDIRAMTFFHYLEEHFESRLSPSPLTTEKFSATVRIDGKTLTTQTRLYAPELSRRRRIVLMLPELRRLGGVTTTRIGRLRVMLVRTEAALAAFQAVLSSGKTFYVRS